MNELLLNVFIDVFLVCASVMLVAVSLKKVLELIIESNELLKRIRKG